MGDITNQVNETLEEMIKKVTDAHLNKDYPWNTYLEEAKGIIAEAESMDLKIEAMERIKNNVAIYYGFKSKDARTVFRETLNRLSKQYNSQKEQIQIDYDVEALLKKATYLVDKFREMISGKSIDYRVMYNDGFDESGNQIRKIVTLSIEDILSDSNIGHFSIKKSKNSNVNFSLDFASFKSEKISSRKSRKEEGQKDLAKIYNKYASVVESINNELWDTAKKYANEKLGKEAGDGRVFELYEAFRVAMSNPEKYKNKAKHEIYKALSDAYDISENLPGWMGGDYGTYTQQKTVTSYWGANSIMKINNALGLCKEVRDICDNIINKKIGSNKIIEKMEEVFFDEKAEQKLINSCKEAIIKAIQV